MSNIIPNVRKEQIDRIKAEADSRHQQIRATDARMLQQNYIRMQDNGAINTQPSTKRILMISTPRSGSTWMSKSLEKAELGSGAEWLHPEYIAWFFELFGQDQDCTLETYLDIIFSYIPSQHGISVVNAHTAHCYNLLFPQFNRFGVKHSNLFDLFDECYFITRTNKLQQAYSLAKARKTGCFSSQLADSLLNDSMIIPIETHEFMRCLQEINGHETWFRTTYPHKIASTFIYEDVAKNGIISLIKHMTDIYHIEEVDTETVTSSQLQVQRNENDERYLEQILLTLTNP